MPVALLDANVLWSAPVRDTLLRAAESALFRPVWSQRILEELSKGLLAHRPDLERRQIDRLIAQLNLAFPEARVQDAEGLVSKMTNDPEDRHVLAAAVSAKADILVTWNTQHFPRDACEPYGILVQTPDEFLCDLWDADPDSMVDVIRQQASDLTNPAMGVEELLRVLERLVPKFVSLVLAR